MLSMAGVFSLLNLLISPYRYVMLAPMLFEAFDGWILWGPSGLHIKNANQHNRFTPDFPEILLSLG